MTEKTPVLTKKQQKLSLSAKKTKSKESIRNILASPFTKYWPLLSNEDHQTLKHILNEHLPKLISDKVKIPWNDLKKIPKCERKKNREGYTKKHTGHQMKYQESREGLILGINDVTKALEKEIPKAVLITEDVLPQLMVEHLIDQSVLTTTPVLVVPELRHILKEKCGISSVSLALTDSPRYKLVQKTIENMSKKYPIPKNHIYYDRAQKKLDESIIIIDDSIMEDTLQTNDSNKTQVLEMNENIDKEKTVGVSENSESKKDLYLYRDSKAKRIFVPKNMTQKNTRANLDTSDFIAFSSDFSSVPQMKEKKYVSMKVLRIRGDTNRNKRKIEDMKEKKKKKSRKKKQK